jgi:hypothetical protein
MCYIIYCIFFLIDGGREKKKTIGMTFTWYKIVLKNGRANSTWESNNCTMEW